MVSERTSFIMVDLYIYKTNLHSNFIKYINIYSHKDTVVVNLYPFLRTLHKGTWSALSTHILWLSLVCVFCVLCVYAQRRVYVPTRMPGAHARPNYRLMREAEDSGTCRYPRHTVCKRKLILSTREKIATQRLLVLAERVRHWWGTNTISHPDNSSSASRYLTTGQHSSTAPPEHALHSGWHSS